MNLPIYIARRYFVAKKSHHVINIISWVSVAGVAVGTAGLVIVLSVFNGFGDLVTSLYNAFDPDIKITAVAGKTFDPDEANISAIKKIKSVSAVSQVLEENALLKYRDRQMIAAVKGVDSDFSKTSRLKAHIAEGEMILENGEKNFAIAGSGIAFTLGINLEDVFSQLNIYVPRRGQEVSLNPEDAFTSLLIRPAGVFVIQQDFDTRYLIVPLRFARELIGQEKKVSALEIAVDKNYDADEIKNLVAKAAGKNFLVKDRAEQHDFLDKILTSEKWAVYLILSLILLISAFSIIGSLTMLIIDKKKDAAILLSMGAEVKTVRSIFFAEGLMISLTGGLAGIAVGWLICFLQQQYKFLKLENSEAFVIDAYPVSMMPADFVNVFLIVFAIGAALSRFASSGMINENLLRQRMV